MRPREYARGDSVRRKFHLRNRVAWVGGVHALSPTRVAGYAMRTYSGRPKSNMRFRTLVAMATSVACRPSVCERSPPPITHFQRAISASTRARQLYPDATLLHGSTSWRRELGGVGRRPLP